MSSDSAAERAATMAREKYLPAGFSRYMRYRYTIKDNPYYRKHPLHNVWYNAFYDECRLIDRRIR